MEQHKKKYIIDCINQNYKYEFNDSKLKIYDKNHKEVEYLELLEYLKEEFELDFKESMSIIVRWHRGNDYADYIERTIIDDLITEFS